MVANVTVKLKEEKKMFLEKTTVRRERSYMHRFVWTIIIFLLIVLMAFIAFVEIIHTTLFWLEHFGS